jgi:hypothetical protein
MSEMIINGIVSQRDKLPYLQILHSDKGKIAQLSMAEARNIAMDILQMCARTEADAMIWKFIHEEGLPEAAGAVLMQGFRDFRAKLDQEKIETSYSDPDTGEQK